VGPRDASRASEDEETREHVVSSLSRTSSKFSWIFGAVGIVGESN
jgi:hypothetical protein